LSFAPCRGQVGAPDRSAGGGCATGVVNVRMSANGLSGSPPEPKLVQLDSGAAPHPAQQALAQRRALRLLARVAPAHPGDQHRRAALARDRGEQPARLVDPRRRPRYCSPRLRVSTGTPSSSATSKTRSSSTGTTSTLPSSAQRRITMRSFEVRSVSESSPRGETT
jgi:hypothetical protein